MSRGPVAKERGRNDIRLGQFVEPELATSALPEKSEAANSSWPTANTPFNRDQPLPTRTRSAQIIRAKMTHSRRVFHDQVGEIVAGCSLSKYSEFAAPCRTASISRRIGLTREVVAHDRPMELERSRQVGDRRNMGFAEE